jgi:hypothetical protein
MSMVFFHVLFPDVARVETREVIIQPPDDPLDPSEIPPGHYGLVERYCVDPECDCRRVMITVLGQEHKQPLATISHAFERPPKGHHTPWQTFLDPLNVQSQWSDNFLDLFVNFVLAHGDYAARLVRHYTLVKKAIDDPGHPIHQRIPPEMPVRLPAAHRLGLPPPRRGFERSGDRLAAKQVEIEREPDGMAWTSHAQRHYHSAVMQHYGMKWERFWRAPAQTWCGFPTSCWNAAARAQRSI